MRDFGLGSCLLTLFAGLAAAGLVEWALDDATPIGEPAPVAIYAPSMTELRSELQRLRRDVRERDYRERHMFAAPVPLNPEF